MESVLTSTSKASSATICSRDMSCTSPSSVTPQSSTPPRAFANAAISSAQSSRLGRLGRFPANSTCLNSQALSSPRRNRRSMSASLKRITGPRSRSFPRSPMPGRFRSPAMATPGRAPSACCPCRPCCPCGSQPPPGDARPPAKLFSMPPVGVIPRTSRWRCAGIHAGPLGAESADHERSPQRPEAGQRRGRSWRAPPSSHVLLDLFSLVQAAGVSSSAAPSSCAAFRSPRSPAFRWRPVPPAPSQSRHGEPHRPLAAPGRARP